VGPDTLRTIVGDEIDDARVLVVSPALNESPLAFWMSDADEAIADAEESGAQTAGGLREDGVAANSTTGEGEPLMALQDALATFPADRIVIFVREGDDQRYREDDVCNEAQKRFDVPVTLATL
jgi:4-hydroxyphenylpyruvate dioxygenase-like putative hemolysin